MTPLHRTGDEPAWWARHGVIDPLKIAAKLWMASRQGRRLDDDEASVDDDGGEEVVGHAAGTQMDVT